MKLNLVVLSEGKAQGQKIPITLSQFIIGRDPQCHLRPASPIISKRHCALLIKDNKVVVRDFTSTNGTFVNDEPVKNEKELQNDDVLQLGPISFRIEIIKSVSVNKPTPPPATSKSGGDDEASIAAMLLSFQEGDDPPATGEDSVPSGTTMMDIPSYNGEPQEKPSGSPEEAKEEKPEASKTSSAAAAEILAKYSRRQRK